MSDTTVDSLNERNIEEFGSFEYEPVNISFNKGIQISYGNSRHIIRIHRCLSGRAMEFCRQFGHLALFSRRLKHQMERKSLNILNLLFYGFDVYLRGFKDHLDDVVICFETILGVDRAKLSNLFIEQRPIPGDSEAWRHHQNMFFRFSFPLYVDFLERLLLAMKTWDIEELQFRDFEDSDEFQSANEDMGVV
jgi:hypothetical protein